MLWSEAHKEKNQCVYPWQSKRYNSPHTSMIQFEVLGELLQLAQDPNSKHLGTTVWDASMVFVKFLEKNRRKGQFSSSKLNGKRVIELGAGCGLAGLGMALLGCDVVATDQTEVLPLLMRNVERNTARIKQGCAENPYSVSFGSIQVAELDWGNQQHIAAVDPPFDYIIGTDIVYAEHLLEPLLKTILCLAGPRTIVMLGYELRSTAVHEKMNELWKINFDVKRVLKTRMDSKYQHANIDLLVMRPRNKMDSNLSIGKSEEVVQTEIHYFSAEYSSDHLEETEMLTSESCSWDSSAYIKPNLVTTKAAGCVSEDSVPCSSKNLVVHNEGNIADSNQYSDCNQPPILCTKDADSSFSDSGVQGEEDSSKASEYSANDKQLDGVEEVNIPFKSTLSSDLKGCDDWQLRRYGSLAARLLKDVQIP